VGIQSTTIRISRSVSRRRAVWASAPCGSLVRRCYPDFDTGCAGTYRGRADTVDRQDRQRHRVRRLDRLARCKAVQQRQFTQSIEARLADEASQRCRQGGSPRARLGEFLGPHDPLLSLHERLYHGQMTVLRQRPQHLGHAKL